MSDYQLPKIWTTPESMQGRFGGINRPTAGSRFEQKLPRGTKPFQVYSLGTPNGIKVTIMFEELKHQSIQEADYDLFKIDIMELDQFGSDFVNINPNAKIPAMLDLSAEKPVRVFESSSILLYLADKFNQFMPKNFAKRTEVLNWLFWQTGAAPFLGGGFGHFFCYAPEKLEYPINRFSMEAKRQLDLLDKELANKTYITGEEYTIADIAIWSWYGRLAQGDLYAGSREFLDIDSYQNVIRWTKLIATRSAVKKALTIEYRSIK